MRGNPAELTAKKEGENMNSDRCNDLDNLLPLMSDDLKREVLARIRTMLEQAKEGDKAAS